MLMEKIMFFGCQILFLMLLVQNIFIAQEFNLSALLIVSLPVVFLDLVVISNIISDKRLQRQQEIA